MENIKDLKILKNNIQFEDERIGQLLNSEKVELSDNIIAVLHGIHNIEGDRDFLAMERYSIFSLLKEEGKIDQNINYNALYNTVYIEGDNKITQKEITDKEQVKLVSLIDNMILVELFKKNEEISIEVLKLFFRSYSKDDRFISLDVYPNGTFEILYRKDTDENIYNFFNQFIEDLSLYKKEQFEFTMEDSRSYEGKVDGQKMLIYMARNEDKEKLAYLTCLFDKHGIDYSIYHKMDSDYLKPERLKVTTQYNNLIKTNKMDTNKPNYVGNVWQKTLADNRKVFSVSLNKETINSIAQDDNGSICLSITPRKETGKNGETHNIYENTYNKDQQKDKYAIVNVLVNKEQLLSIAQENKIRISVVEIKEKKEGRASDYFVAESLSKDEREANPEQKGKLVGVAFNIRSEVKEVMIPKEMLCGRMFENISGEGESSFVSYNLLLNKAKAKELSKEDKMYINLVRANGFNNQYIAYISKDKMDPNALFTLNLDKEKIENIVSNEKGDISLNMLYKKKESIKEDMAVGYIQENLFKKIEKPEEKNIVGKFWDKENMFWLKGDEKKNVNKENELTPGNNKKQMGL